MKTNSDTTRTLYIGLDVHKAETVIAILVYSDRIRLTLGVVLAGLI